MRQSRSLWQAVGFASLFRLRQWCSCCWAVCLALAFSAWTGASLLADHRDKAASDLFCLHVFTPDRRRLPSLLFGRLFLGTFTWRLIFA